MRPAGIVLICPFANAACTRALSGFLLRPTRLLPPAFRILWRAADVRAGDIGPICPLANPSRAHTPASIRPTQILRRAADIADLPYLKVMASRFLEPGRSSIETVIEELVECAIDRAFDSIRYDFSLRWC